MSEGDQLGVLLTVDTEIWCDGWQNIDAKFPEAFRKYIYGPTQHGDYGLPFQLKVLNDNGLRAVFFVEVLFAMRFGLAPLEEIIGLITEAGQSVELHLHTEWVDEARAPIFGDISEKRQHIQYSSYDEQCQLLHKGIELLTQAGATMPTAYRAGSFGANNDTLRALATTDVRFDSSLNITAPACAISTDRPMHQPATLEGVLEVPMTVFNDGIGKRRQAQITACSFSEMVRSLNDAIGRGWKHFVILSHSFELLTPDKTRRDPVVTRRFVKLCEYLGVNRDRFPTVNFASPDLLPTQGAFELPGCGPVATLSRLGEQAWGRFQ